jgi:hypothetical protein
MYTMILLFLVTNGSREEFIKRNKNILDMSNYPELCKKIGIDLSETNKQKIRTKGFQDGLITRDELLHCQNIKKSTYNIRSDLHEVKTIGYKGKEILVQS